MKHLSGLDALFLHMEQGNQYMHVAGLGIYDPSSAPGGKVRFKSVLKFFSDRLAESRVFRRRLVQPPFGIDRPYWVEDGEIDIEYHVRHIALPHPGDWRQLMIQVARIHSRPLDMTKPLWEAYIIEGLDNVPGIPPGAFAMYTKFHHAALDGEAGAALIRALHTASPDGDGEGESSASHTIIADREPTAIELYARAFGNRAKQMLEASRLVAELGGRAAQAGTEALMSGKATEASMKLFYGAFGGQAVSPKSGDTPGAKVHTRFDNPVSAHRVVDAVGFPLADCRRIREHIEGVTINDIFLAATAGGVRKYLELKGELPERGLNAMVPVSTRSGGSAKDGGNQVGMSVMPLRTDIADPLERLHAVKRGSGKSKALTNALGKDLPIRLLDVLPAYVSDRLLRMSIMAMSNVTVSNVRGPDQALYMAGAQLVLFLPVSIAFTGIGLNVTGFSYNGTLWVCFVSCRQMIPDPGVFSQCLNEAFEELVAAALGVGPKVRARVTTTDAPAPSKPRARRTASAEAAKPKAGKAARAKRKPAAKSAPKA